MKSAVVCLLAATLLGGCALPRMIDSEVQSFAGATAPAVAARFAFERLPSQQGSTQQDEIERLSAAALQKVGLQPLAGAGDATAAANTPIYLAQVRLQISQIANPHHSAPRSSLFQGWGDQRPGGLGLTLVMEPPWVRHVVQIVLRERASHAVVYETSATFDGPWSDTTNLLPAMLEAALRDYPTPGPGPRKVVIELPAAPRQP